MPTRKTKPSAGKPTAPDSRAIVLELEKWLPYRCSVIANAVSLRLADFYHRRYGLTVHAWRMMAALGRRPHSSALDLAGMTAMDQVSVTRALNHLSALGMVIRGTDTKDRRKAVLELSAKGYAVYRAVVPLALDLEAALTAGLTRADLALLDRVLGRIQRNAASLQSPEEMPLRKTRSRVRAGQLAAGRDRPAVRMPRALML